MTPPFVVGSGSALAEADLAEPVAFQPTPLRGPTPEYRPQIGPSDVPASDPRWAQLDALRQEAWDKGITAEELKKMEDGSCPYQMSVQTSRLTHWNATR